MILEKIVKWLICFVMMTCSGNAVQVSAAVLPNPPVYSFCASSKLAMIPLSNRPSYSVKSFGARGDGRTDDTKAIQTALNLLPPSSILTFPAGTYLYSSVLTVSGNGAILQGQGGVLKATNASAQAVLLKGTRNVIMNMNIQGTGTVRSGQPQTALIWVMGESAQVINNNLSGSASGGIFLYGAKDFRVVGNKVQGTLADGIHMTGGSRRGLVEGNVVSGTGDDMIAVVSYCGAPGATVGANLAGDILIRKNQVSANTWGRGITVVGGENVSIVSNKISDVTLAAGILIAQEGSYNTCGVNGVYISDNDVQRIETAPPPQGKWYTHQAAIDVNSSNQRPVQYIQIDGNRITDAGFSGVRLLDDIRHVKITGNIITKGMQKSKEQPVAVVRGLSPAGELLCTGNSSDGNTVTVPPAQCATPEKYRDPWPTFNFTTPQGDVWANCATPR